MAEASWESGGNAQVTHKVAKCRGCAVDSLTVRLFVIQDLFVSKATEESLRG